MTRPRKLLAGEFDRIVKRNDFLIYFALRKAGIAKNRLPAVFSNTATAFAKPGSCRAPAMCAGLWLVVCSQQWSSCRDTVYCPFSHKKSAIMFNHWTRSRLTRPSTFSPLLFFALCDFTKIGQKLQEKLKKWLICKWSFLPCFFHKQGSGARAGHILTSRESIVFVVECLYTAAVRRTVVHE